MRWSRAVVAAAVVVLVAAAPADAVRSPKKAMWGITELRGESWLPIYEDLGVGILQLQVRWDEVATSRPANPRDPSDPAYRWPADVERAIAGSPAHGIKPHVRIHGTPSWANGGRAFNVAPSRAADFADFARAAARRWPGVRLWQIWNEPTQEFFWRPQPRLLDRAPRGSELLGARRYAEMLDAAYGALKAEDRRNLVIGGNSWTVGNIRPLFWPAALRRAFGRAPRMDLYGHNPFTARRIDMRLGPVRPGTADFNDLDSLARQLDRHLRRPGQRRGPRLFLSEFAIPTRRAHPFYFFFSEAEQARRVRQVYEVARRWDRIYALGYFNARDNHLPGTREDDGRGLIRIDGTRRPAYEAYKNAR
jgi:hypothetical protein